MKLYNTFSQKKEIFTPINSGEVLIYSCGPTVYNYIHIGNARPICVFDVLRRYLEYLNYNVKFVQNFTDIDDKIIKKAQENNTDYKSISEKYIEEYKKDAQGLNIKPATIHPKATENIKEIINIIENLIKKEFAYVLKNGDVYFRTRKFGNYGNLSHQSIDELQSGARININDSKEDFLDFALWKSAKPGEPYWESPWGKGRPGWHIECSAMAQKYLSSTIDIHCGGQDLIFPHHENEIAQSECSTGQKFANYWLHNGYININNTKMSKSLNNFFTVREISEIHGYEPIRYFLISSHYRTPINFSEEIIIQCKNSLERLYKFKENIEFMLENSINNTQENEFDISKYKQKFLEALDDDLNTADAISVIFELVKDVNTNILSTNKFCKSDIISIKNFFEESTNILGILYNNKNNINNNLNKNEIEELIKSREQARKDKNWKLADEIRDKLKLLNITIEDTPNGTKFVYNK